LSALLSTDLFTYIYKPLALEFCLSAWRRGGDSTQGATYRRASPWNPCGALLGKTLQLNLGDKSIPAENRPFTQQSTPSMAPIDYHLAKFCFRC